MGKNKRLSHDQKRKAKLKKRAERSRQNEPLAYEGQKYKTDAFAPVFFRTELGIFESYVMSRYELTDDDVEEALEGLVLQMRRGPLPPYDHPGEVRHVEGGEDELVIANVRRNWQIMREEEGLSPSRDDLIGVLRTILHSIEIWRSKQLHSRGYLHYIEGFMKKMGVSARVLPAEGEPTP